MTRHLLRLVWNRKRQNLLLTIEIFLSFLVLFVVVFFAFTYYSNWRQPLGFKFDRVWTISMPSPFTGPAEPEADASVVTARQNAAATLARIYAALRDLSNVESTAGSWPSSPYGSSGWQTGVGDPTIAQTSINFATDDFDDTLGITLTAGRWFSRDDDAGTIEPAVINERLARELFGTSSPVNQELPPLSFRSNQRLRVVGVIDDFRHEGELSMPGNYVFLRIRQDNAGADAVLPNDLVVRMAPGTTADFEPVLAKTLEQIAPDRTFEIRPLDVEREVALRSWMSPLITVSIVASFLLLMVGLGLIGVVWQSVTKRTQEFGLRRAKGATISSIQRQVLTEIALLTSLALVVGVALVAQLPALPLRQMDLPAPPASVWFSSIAVSVSVIYLLTLACAWYPSRLATRIQPAEALHYE
jgi:putative ABC transport system permease protein